MHLVGRALSEGSAGAGRWRPLAGGLRPAITAAVTALLLGACAPQTVVETQVVEQIVTREVRVEVPVPREPFTTPHPILGDLRVRKAIAYCTNRGGLVASVYPFVDDPTALYMDTSILTDHWAHADGVEQYPFDPAQGMVLLEQAGWTLGEGADFRTNAAGEELSLKFTTTTAQFRQTWGGAFVQDMAGCGIRIVPLYAPASWWFGDTTGLARRDFELGAFAWVGEADPGGVTLYACDQIPLPDNGWEGQNTMGWCNETASAAIKAANNTLDREERIAQYAIFQQEFAKDMISLPLFNRIQVDVHDSQLQGFLPEPGEPLYMWNVAEWEIPGQNVIVIGFSAEPASLDPTTENSFISQNLDAIIYGVRYTTVGYDYQPRTQAEFPSPENGGAQWGEVEAREGDRVVDVNGQPVDLAPGIELRLADGSLITYEGGPVKLPRLTAVYRFVEDLTWSDGQGVRMEDFELFYRKSCGPSSVAFVVQLVECEQLDEINFDPYGYTITWLPGMFRPDYFLAPFGYLPSHVQPEDNRTLDDVLARGPMPSVGPYVLKEWISGEHMTFEANPLYYDSPPKTKTIVILFMESDLADRYLRDGRIDFAGWEVIGTAVTDSLIQAVDEGLIAMDIIPSETWEHIDMNLWVPWGE